MKASADAVVAAGGVVVGVVVPLVGVTTAAAVVGAAVTGIVTVLVGHVAGDVAQLGPLHAPVLGIVPVASVALAVTEKVSV